MSVAREKSALCRCLGVVSVISGKAGTSISSVRLKDRLINKIHWYLRGLACVPVTY